MNDVERRLRDLGDRAGDEVIPALRPRADALRRIRRRRAALSTTALACVATIGAAGAFAWTGEGSREPLPPADGPSVAEPRGCRSIPFEPTYVPEGFEREPARPVDGGTPGLVATFESNRPASIQVTTRHYAFVQTRPRPIEVLGAPGTIGLVHEGYSVEFHHGACEYVLNGYGVTKSELRRFATGLVPAGKAPSVTVAWPEDTFEDAERACAEAEPRERTAPQVVSRFATEVLGWDSPIWSQAGSSGRWTITPGGGVAGAGVPAGVQAWTTEVVPGCWSITSASRLPDRRPTGVGVSVRGRLVEIAYDTLGASEVSVEVGYGGRTREVYDRRGRGFVRVRLQDHPDTTGHFLVLFRNGDGDVFTAHAVPLPAGDFTAG
jgi:hypothetical protein